MFVSEKNGTEYLLKVFSDKRWNFGRLRIRSGVAALIYLHPALIFLGVTQEYKIGCFLWWHYSHHLTLPWGRKLKQQRRVAARQMTSVYCTY